MEVQIYSLLFFRARLPGPLARALGLAVGGALLIAGTGGAAWSNEPREAIAGEWVSYSLDVLIDHTTGHCGVLSLEERTYTMTPEDSGARAKGRYKMQWNVRLMPGFNTHCDDKNEEGDWVSLLLENRETRVWDLTAEAAEDDRFRISARFAECSNDAPCSEVEERALTFKATLHLSYGEVLVDLDNSLDVGLRHYATQPRFFRRPDVLAAWAAEAEAGWDEILSLVREEEFGRIRDERVSTLSAHINRVIFPEIYEGLEVLPGIRNAMEDLVQQETEYVYVADRLTEGGLLNRAERFAVIMRRWDFDDAAFLDQRVVLHEQGGVWKLVSFEWL